jgi:hypothetical protein
LEVFLNQGAREFVLELHRDYAANPKRNHHPDVDRPEWPQVEGTMEPVSTGLKRLSCIDELAWSCRRIHENTDQLASAVTGFNPDKTWAVA